MRSSWINVEIWLSSLRLLRDRVNNILKVGFYFSENTLHLRYEDCSVNNVK
jgi:hypothetical protein